MEIFISKDKEDIMQNYINPFLELYIGEHVEANSYIKIFSPFLCKQKHALPIFQAINLVVLGSKGNGKTMLLQLLDTDTRIEYIKTNQEYPVPEKLCNFVSAGINLSTSGITNFGQRAIVEKDKKEEELTALYFADYLNYWVIFDLIVSLEKMSNVEQFKDMIGLNFSKKSIDSFVKSISNEDCWFSYLKGLDNWEDLKLKIKNRIIEYKKFFSFNIDTIPEEIRQSKTIIGEPISTFVNALKKNAIVNSTTKFFIKIDQLEIITGLEVVKKYYGKPYRQIINKALGNRDSNIFFKVGARYQSWFDTLHIYGTSNFLEEERDYKTLEIDEILKRREDPSTWVFPKLAEDIFHKRLEYIGFKINSDPKIDLLKAVFKNGYTPERWAEIYAGTSRNKVLRIDDTWNIEWKHFLENLAEMNPLSARLIEAWSRQIGLEKKEVMVNLPKNNIMPWQKHNRPYWKKERVGQALLQIAARCGQRLRWAGKEDILALSGGNTLAFLKICQHIWSTWLRDINENDIQEGILPNINEAVQSIGIQEASNSWYNQVIVRENDGDKRRDFLSKIGNHMYKELYEDDSMSYPGNNGFSLKLDDIDNAINADIKNMLNLATDYGDLYESSHTTKTKDKAKRKKWYLNPILSPYFKIHVEHTKEPKYLSVKELRDILNSTTNNISKNNSTSNDDNLSNQLNLFKDSK